MAKQLLLWTVLPFGKVRDGSAEDGRWRVSAVVSPRLTPETASEQVLKAFPGWRDWPATLERAKFAVRIGTQEIGLIRLGKADSDLWGKLFTDETPVAGFEFKDMSAVNLFSFPVKNVLAFARKHYGRLAVQAAATHPTLLPWRDAHPDLKGMLDEMGTRTQTLTFGDRKIEVPLPGFSRFFEGDLEERLRATVFGQRSPYRVAVPAPDAEEEATPGVARQVQRRAMSPDWVNPRPSGPNGPLSGAPDAPLMDQFHSAEEYSFYQANRFYRRGERDPHKRYPDYQGLDAPPTAPEYDFHRIVASFADYPALLRRLGLVVDFALEDGAVIDNRVAAGNGEGKGQIQLRIDWDGGPPGEDAFPRSAWIARKERFVPRPRGQDLDAGLLRLEHSDDGWRDDKEEGRFDLYQVDPDGAALKTVNFTLTAQNLVAKNLDFTRKHGAVTYTTGERQAVAALRSGGIGVSQHGRAVTLATDTAAADLKNQEIAAGNAEKVVLFAEDVHRGFRIDVARVPDLVNPGRWNTLCARQGDYRLVEAGGQIDLPPDEGHVSGASTTSSGEDDDHYLHETLFRWTGWSLVAPRPGLTIKAETNEDDELQAEVPSEVTEVATSGNGVAVSFRAVKGTLPRLRFGELYRLRARVVDVAGNSLSFDDPSTGPLEQASDAVGYWRFEPVDPPAMVHRGRVSEGEALERMVIRSNFDADTKGYLTAQDFVDARGGPLSVDFDYTAVNERHLVPPKSSQQQCETHGLFDPLFGAWQDIKSAYEIAAREAGSLYDEVPGSDVALVTPKSLGEVATTSQLPPALPDAGNPVGDRLAGGQYVIHREAHVATPYLPDGAAGGVALRAAPGHALPGVSGPMDLGPGCRVVNAPNNHLVIMVRRGADWPKCDGFRLILAERPTDHVELPCKESFLDDGAPRWDPDERTLTLFVAKGRIVRLVYSSFVEKDMIGHFGIPRWTTSAQEAEFVAMTAMAGTNWLITPYRKLTLVHAVQQPVCLPELENLTPNRGPGEQHARLICRAVRLHGPSTGKFEIEAAWREWVDDITKPGPERTEFRGQLGEIALAENHVNEFTLQSAVQAQMLEPEAQRGDRHELGDTRFRLIEYRARATTRFREYLPPPLYDDPEKISRLGPVAEGPAYALPPEGDKGAPVLSDPAGSTGQSRVLASAPPKDPRLMYLVPTFRWGERPASGPHDVTRTGNGLRVWLDRPWFSSGDGELLGVILHQDGGNFTDIPAAMQAMVTQWGVDPLWASTLPKVRTLLTDFPARVTSGSVRLQERPGDPFVRVVGHRVHWDEARGLWYCDVELDPGVTYMPFVRLSLVRYQPNAIGGSEISKVVLADFAQVLPRRRLRVSLQGGQITVALHGQDPQSGPMRFDRDSAFQNVSFVNPPFETGRNRVEVVLQEQEAGIDSDLGWRDVQVLASHVVGEDPPEEPGGVRPGGLGIGLGAVVAERGGIAATVTRRAGGTASFPSVLERTPVLTDPFVFDPAFWSATFDAPAAGERRRLAIREFERFYSDNTVNQRVGSGTFPRRIVEERLVFTDLFDPATL